MKKTSEHNEPMLRLQEEVFLHFLFNITYIHFILLFHTSISSFISVSYLFVSDFGACRQTGVAMQ